MREKTLELQKKVKELRAKGLSYTKIGEELGITRAYAHILDRPEMYNTEERKIKHKQYRDVNKAKNLAYGKEWRKNNPEYMKNWYNTHKDKYKEYYAQKHA